jgi:hypothetical protein
LTDNPLQYVISLPLAVSGAIFILYLEHMVLEENAFFIVGFISFVCVIYFAFILGDKLISMIEVKRKR